MSCEPETTGASWSVFFLCNAAGQREREREATTLQGLFNLLVVYTSDFRIKMPEIPSAVCLLNITLC